MQSRKYLRKVSHAEQKKAGIMNHEPALHVILSDCTQIALTSERPLWGL